MLVQCRNCSKQFKVTEKMFGRKVKCTCGTVMQMPAAPASQPKPAAVATGYDAADVQFQCPKCMQRLSVPASAAGQVTACPCGAKIRVPQAPAAPANDPYALPAEHGGMDELDQLDEIGLEPMGNDSFANAGLDNQYGLSPLEHSGGDANAYGVPTGQPAYLQPSKPMGGGRKIVRKPREQESGGTGGGFGINSSVLSGIGMMIGALVWFFGGLALNIFFVYPPILFFIGLFTMISGFFGGGD